MDGQAYAGRFRLFMELMLTGWAILVVWLCLGLHGAIIVFFSCIPALVLITVIFARGNTPNWHWRLWVMENTHRWTEVMLATLSVALLLGATEVSMNMRIHRLETLPSLRQIIQAADFRDIPAYAEPLEADIQQRLEEWSRPEGMSDEEWQKESPIYLSAIAVLAFILFLIVSYILVPRTFGKRLRGKKHWEDGVGKSDAGTGPYVPYLPKASKWRIPRLLRMAIIAHCIFGGIIQLAAAAFCFEGFCYAFVGRTILCGQTANLWSWMFAMCKILFGNSAGWGVGMFLLSVISLPVLMAGGTFIRRLLAHVALAIRVIGNQLAGKKRDSQYFRQSEEFAKKACLHLHLKTPLIWMTSDKAVNVRLHWLALLGNSVIEISSGAIGLLDDDELQAVLAHEIGHVKQGVWKIAILKLLSAVAFFPNHYLTLCLNWAGNEMDADRIAQALTNNPQSLQRALMKIAAAQSRYLKQRFEERPAPNAISGIGLGVKNALRIRYYAIRFFFGDSLFGYAHPFLSERLKALESPLRGKHEDG